MQRILTKTGILPETLEPKSYTMKYRKHIPYIFCYYIKYESIIINFLLFIKDMMQSKRSYLYWRKILLKLDNLVKKNPDKYESLKSMIDFDEKNHHNRTNICQIREINT